MILCLNSGYGDIDGLFVVIELVYANVESLREFRMASDVCIITFRPSGCGVNSSITVPLLAFGDVVVVVIVVSVAVTVAAVVVLVVAVVIVAEDATPVEIDLVVADDVSLVVVGLCDTTDATGEMNAVVCNDNPISSSTVSPTLAATAAVVPLFCILSVIAAPAIDSKIAIVASPTAHMSAFTFCLRVMTAFHIVTFRHHKNHLNKTHLSNQTAKKMQINYTRYDVAHQMFLQTNFDKRMAIVALSVAMAFSSNNNFYAMSLLGTVRFYQRFFVFFFA